MGALIRITGGLYLELLVGFNQIENVYVQAHEDQCKLRTPTEHNQQCAEIEQDATNSLSVEYGINTTCILNGLKYFHTCNGALIPDIMHDILEGGLQYEVKLMLNKLIYEDKYFTLEVLNFKLENFDYGYLDVKNRPSPITTDTLTASSSNSLKQNGNKYGTNYTYYCICL